MKWYIVYPLLSAMSLVVLLAVHSENSQGSDRGLGGDNKVETSEIEYLEVEEVLSEFDENLVEVFGYSGAEVEAAYRMTEGVPFSMSSGVYVVGRLEGGDVIWLVSVAIDEAYRVYTVEAVAYVTAQDWNRYLIEAHDKGLSFPSPRYLCPDDTVQSFCGDLRVRGEYFGSVDTQVSP